MKKIADTLSFLYNTFFYFVLYYSLDCFTSSLRGRFHIFLLGLIFVSGKFYIFTNYLRYLENYFPSRALRIAVYFLLHIIYLIIISKIGYLEINAPII